VNAGINPSRKRRPEARLKQFGDACWSIQSLCGMTAKIWIPTADLNAPMIGTELARIDMAIRSLEEYRRRLAAALEQAGAS
jgi:hypothetical protein